MMTQASCILVIDDNAMNLNIAQDLLEHTGLSVITALDAMNGIRLMKENKPSLVLLDLLMPGCDGFETLENIKKDSELQDIPIIAFTALASLEDKEKALKGGCKDIILKPINTETFIKTIQDNLLSPNYLEFKPVHIREEDEAPESKELGQQKKHPILIVDDNPINVDILKEAILAMDQVAYTALSGEEAIKIISENKPDLILLDIMMPKMDGYEVLNTLKKKSGTDFIPVIIISAVNSTEERVRGFKEGARDYITKPFEIIEVQARIESILKSKELQENLTQREIDLKILLTREQETIVTLEETVQNLQESEKRFRMMADASPAMIWMFNPNLEVTYFNTSALAFCGATDLEQINWQHAVFSDDLSMVVKVLTEAVKNKKAYQVEYRFLRYDSTYRWMTSQGNPRLDLNGVLLGFVGTSIDIHDHKTANELLEKHVLERTTQLVSANKELEAFSYTVSHDLRAPLRSINGFSQALVDAYDSQLDEEGRDYLARIRRATQQMGMLIDEMLKLFKLSRTELIFEESVHLSQIVQEIVENHVILDANCPVHYTIQPEVHVKGDRRLLQAVLQNLLDNAWKFSSKSESAAIEFGHYENNGENIYFLKDNGVGFDMAYVDKLFGVFQRLHSSRDFPGNGIGLANCARIIHRHGGRIWAEAILEKGATFFFTLSSDCEKLPLNQSFNSQVSV
jgi:PAS domain S-box-containing protein